MQGALSYVGDRLGIFKALAGAGAVTVAELAQRTGLNERYLREWLGAMTAAKYIEYDPASARYTMSPEHAMILADETSQFFMGGFMQMIVPEVSMAPKLMESFRTGKGLPQSEYPPEVFEAIERGSAPMYRHQLVRKWIPSMPEVEARLRQGAGAVARCRLWQRTRRDRDGVGSAELALPGLPRASGVGRSGAGQCRGGGRVADCKVEFGVVDCTQAAVAEKFDFISCFDVIHDSVDPVGLMKSIRAALKPDGAFLMVEVNVSARPEDNINPMGRMMYAASTLYCMTVSLAHGGAGIGALMGEEKARELAAEGGLHDVSFDYR